VPYSQWYLFNAIPNTNHNANPTITNPNHNSKGNPYLYYIQWLKCNGTQGNAVPPTRIYDSKCSPTSGCYSARERHRTIVRGPNL